MVYNTFPWPHANKEQRKEIKKTGQLILNARELYSDSSLADLYDELTMPNELRKAHQQNDKAVMRAYGLRIGPTTEADAIAHLIEMYKESTY